MNEEKPTIHQIVKRYLPDVMWLDLTTGRCTCPGQHKHTQRSTKKDCRVYVNGVPTVTCLHQSCEAEVNEANSQIRRAWNLFQPELPAEELAKLKEATAKRYALIERAKASLPEVLRRYKWNVEEIGHVKERPLFQFLSLFKPDDVVWIGEPEDSGEARHAGHFSCRNVWEEELNYVDMHYTTASTFKPGTYSRGNAYIASTPYMIVEGDRVLGKEPITEEEKIENKNACGAIFKWLRDGCGLRLRAVIDSGNKSLHGWFDMPHTDKFEELKLVLPAMGCDRAMFKPAQPARLPGVIRDNGNEQRLLYLN